jgi:hypothetical protein
MTFGAARGHVVKQKKEELRLIDSRIGSLSRLAEEKKHIAKTLGHPHVRSRLQDVARPKSLAGGMRRAGIALILCPDPLGPVVDIPAVALLASSYVAKRKEPSSAKSVVADARKLLQDIESLRV